MNANQFNGQKAPSPEAIAAKCAEIRAKWTRQQERARNQYPVEAVETAVIRTADTLMTIWQSEVE